jgi:hypothetical protein
MTKKEIINKLVTEYGFEGSNLTKKTVKELEEILEGVKKEADKIEIEKAEAIETKASTDEVVSEVQLNIYETIVRRFDSSKNLRIENLGAGDVFIGEIKENLIQEKNKIVPGQSKTIEDISVLYITSASRPIIRIIY